MARKKKQQGPTEVDAITHKETRANIPTADARDLVAPEIEEVVEVSYPREIRSPMLVWKGKESLDDEDLQVDAPPIYIQEKIDPRVLIENLRKTAAAGEREPELTLFDTFDGLSELDLVEFYKHSANWSNRMVLGDSLQVMASLAERERLRGKVQMIYMDPPYGIKFGSNWQVSARQRSVKDGDREHVAREAEQVKAFRDTWELGIHSYLSYMRDRLQIGRDLLTDSGSMFMQIGDENVHLVRSLMDEVFGSENFVAMIAFKRTTGERTTTIPRVYDWIVWYGRSVDSLKLRKLFLRKELGDQEASQYRRVLLPDGSSRAIEPLEAAGLQALPTGARAYRLGQLSSASPGKRFEVDFEGQHFLPPPGRYWSTNPNGMQRLIDAGRIISTGDRIHLVQFLDDSPTSPLLNGWTDTVVSGFSDVDAKAYVVQTATRVVERCMLMSTDPGDLVLDPTCGSGTTAYVAEQWGRRWITTDTSRVALAIARQRLAGSRFPYFVLADSEAGREKEGQLTGSALPPAAVGNDIRRGFVYERVPHVTLSSIANNPDVQPGMSRVEVDMAIARHSATEMLFDRPLEDSTKVRVTGPYTVESLSPHRNLAGPGVEATSTDSGSIKSDSGDFEHMVLENLRASGVQNGRKAERLEFDLIESYAGTHVQAVGIREEAPDGAPKRVGLSLGPQYGTVAPTFVKNAAREASKDKDLDLLCILAFAFDPQVLNTDEDYVATDESFDVAGTRSLGRIPVLLVRMNADLLMGEELKKTGAGNLFTVFGEPDIAIKEEGEEVRVELLGVDVYDPTTGEVRSDQTDKIALWMIDTDYDEESFFVRHCYFTGGQDPYKRLKKSLNADIDEESWATLYQTVSRPFPKPSTGKIAVKVINDYGDEVLKVYDVA